MTLNIKVKNYNSYIVKLAFKFKNQLGGYDSMEIESKQYDELFKIKKNEDYCKEQEIINLTIEVFEQYHKTMKDLVER